MINIRDIISFMKKVGLLWIRIENGGIHGKIYEEVAKTLGKRFTNIKD